MKKYAAICSKQFRNWKKTVIKKSRRIKYKIITAKGREWKILFVEKKEGSVYIKDKVVNVENTYLVVISILTVTKMTFSGKNDKDGID